MKYILILMMVPYASEGVSTTVSMAEFDNNACQGARGGSRYATQGQEGRANLHHLGMRAERVSARCAPPCTGVITCDCRERLL